MPLTFVLLQGLFKGNFPRSQFSGLCRGGVAAVLSALRFVFLLWKEEEGGSESGCLGFCKQLSIAFAVGNLSKLILL